MTAPLPDAPAVPGPGHAPPRVGTGVRSARGAVDDGLIGDPVAATAFITAPDPERPCPASELYDRPGGGPLFGLGPHHLCALVHLLGPVSRVTGAASQPDAELTGLLEHAGGALTTLVVGSGSHPARLPRVEVHGTEGSLALPGPDGFDGPVELHRAGGGWQPLPVSGGHRGGGAGPGVPVAALTEDLPRRDSDELARHALDIMQTLLDAARDGVWLPVRGDHARPEAVRP